MFTDDHHNDNSSVVAQKFGTHQPVLTGEVNDAQAHNDAELTRRFEVSDPSANGRAANRFISLPVADHIVDFASEVQEANAEQEKDAGGEGRREESDPTKLDDQAVVVSDEHAWHRV